MSLYGRGRGAPARVSASEAAAGTGHTGTSVLLDVREADEWYAGHAPGAVHLPLAALASGAALPHAAQARPVVVICRSGNRSRQAAELLCARGVKAVDVVGGMRAWVEEGLPVVDARGGNGTVA
ncbi:sulfurtransferase [Streptomyces sp. IMTB 2501]|uniref:rhodanese-like domain-containing protein n=1 Tax=Streptomyces sp. IMTB 2501 TaxID=1776340 RepID=UPI00096FC0AE|nr:rhodanese-like domain-containing protein [Streptomyces sp. IMTB 2501]OLZ73443.1 sulfurtransferase [Streptomyces sp. IMTB 2501]